MQPELLPKYGLANYQLKTVAFSLSCCCC